MKNSFQDFDKYLFEINIIDNKMERTTVSTVNYRPKKFKYVFVYFGDKYYPASSAEVRNFYACQGSKGRFQVEFKKISVTLLQPR